MKKILLCIGLFFLISCTNDDSQSEVDTNQNPIDFFPQNYIGTSGQLKKMRFTMEGNHFSNWYFSYIGNKLDKKSMYNSSNTLLSYEYTYEYTNDLISKILISNGISEELNYDNQNRLIEKIGYNYKDEFEYLNNGIRWKKFMLDSNNNFNLIGDNLLIVDNNNQILEIKNYSSNSSVVIFEYDNKIAPMRNILGFNKLLNNYNVDDSAFNNLTKQIDPFSSTNMKNVIYDYNNENKPIKAKYYDNNGLYLIIEIEYYN